MDITDAPVRKGLRILLLHSQGPSILGARVLTRAGVHAEAQSHRMQLIPYIAHALGEFRGVWL